MHESNSFAGIGLKITQIYSDLEAFWDKEAADLKAGGDHPMDFKRLYAVRKYRDHKKLLDIKGPAVIIAGSWMSYSHSTPGSW